MSEGPAWNDWDTWLKNHVLFEVVHAVARVNATTSILKGGNTAFTTSNKTWFFNHVSQSFQAGPSLITGRWAHASATIQDKVTKEDIVAVVGGSSNSADLSSTELLINGESEWQEGPNLPQNRKLTHHSAIEIGGDLYTVGGITSSKDWTLETEIHRMSCSNRICSWKTMNQELTVKRQFHSVVPIPKSMCVPN
jgi:hypothetical protein